MQLSKQEQETWEQLSNTPEELELKHLHEKTMAELDKLNKEINAIGRGEIETSVEVIDQGHGVRTIKYNTIDHRKKKCQKTYKNSLNNFLNKIKKLFRKKD